MLGSGCDDFKNKTARQDRVSGQRAAVMVVLIAMGCALGAPLAWAETDQTQQAQRLLGVLGFDAGTPDGKIGPRTRRAIAAFQHSNNLEVTRELDQATLAALGLVPPDGAISTRPPPSPTPPTPWRTVLAYLRYYDTQPARLLDYVTERFRGGVGRQAWIRRTASTLAQQQFSRLSWKIERVELAAARNATAATVQVHSEVRISGADVTRRETFSLIRSDNAAWLIDNWRSQPIVTAEQKAER